MMKKKAAPELPQVIPPFQPGRWETVWVAAILALLIGLHFHQLLSVYWGMEAGDAQLWSAHRVKLSLLQGLFATAMPYLGLGNMGALIVGDFTPLFWAFLPAAKSMEAIAAFAVLLGAVFFYLFLRGRQYGFWPSLAGMIAYGFSTTIISVASAGHIGKFYGLAYVAGGLWLMDRAFTRKSWLAAAGAGLSVGYSLAQARDLSMLLVLGAGAFWLWEILARQPRDFKDITRKCLQLALAGAIALIVTWPVFKILSPANPSIGPETQDPQLKWEWATQWSLPADESAKLICASYCGWDSWDSKAPYWGRMGRSYQWEENHQGFRNFTQTNEYLGVIAFVMALAAVLVWIRRRMVAGDPWDVLFHFRDTLFWGGLALIGLLLAFGKYGPLYRLFYELPWMSSIRNPVKFMHVVALGVAVLTAQGCYYFDAMLRLPQAERKRRWIPLLTSVGIVLLLFLMLFLLQPWRDVRFLARLQNEGFGAQIAGIQQAMQAGIEHSFFWSLFLLAVFLVCRIPWGTLAQRVRRLCLVLVLCLLAGDLLWANGHYIRYAKDPLKQYQSNGVIDFLRSSPAFRVKFIPHTWGVFNYWNSLLVPYYEIKSADLPAESRRSADLEGFYSTIGKMPSRLWQIMGVRHFIVPRNISQPNGRRVEFESELQSILGSAVVQARGFDLVSDAGGQAMTEWAKTANGGQFVVIESAAAIPCGYWYRDAESLPFLAMLNRLCEPGFDVTRTIVLDAKDPVPPDLMSPAREGEPVGVETGRCELVHYSENRIEVQCAAPVKGWVFVNDYYEPGWQAEVDGHPTTLYRANGVFRGVAVPAGKSRVVLEYHGNTATFWVPVTCSGILLLWLLLKIAWGYIRRRQAVQSAPGNS